MAEPAARAAEATADRGWRLRHLPVLLAAVAVMAAVAAVAGGVWRGADGALGAAAGVAVTAASYTLTTVVLAWADARDPQLVLPFGLGLYIAKMTALGGVMVLVASTGWPGLIPFCLGIAAGVVVWTGAHIWWLATVHARRTAG
ncbi:hypothetical protein O7602_04235 [Micromonospora sp. WMMD1128]|uniref:hypothetical protein n=1 Tax=unclassified Micromonospora TaxID=2617518 RepID=UPI00248C6D15|nr:MULTISPECIES: hypothetical protein [unclassified Micromonospora]WBB74764.1 hypothetical protein O7602_04235 [Micromonospora sp. WMMD1128]WFE31866.1 hypothetical protein O7613_19985 [Micromonospora sp. WMMD975]